MWLDLLQYVLPSGALGAALQWLLSSRLRRASLRSKEDSIYRQMYQDLRSDIVKLQKDFTILTYEHNDFKRQLYKASSCPHFDSVCPLHDFLQESFQHDQDNRPSGDMGGVRRQSGDSSEERNAEYVHGY